MRFLNGETTKLNKKYYNGKAVAYMQDTEAWSIYKDSQGYAGYQISWDGGTTWKTLTDNSAGYLSTDTNNLYVVDPSHEKAYAYWVSSPSTVNNENINYYDRVRSYYYNNELVAFRPIVCLSSKVTLELNEVSQKYEIKQ